MFVSKSMILQFGCMINTFKLSGWPVWWGCLFVEETWSFYASNLFLHEQNTNIRSYTVLDG